MKKPERGLTDLEQDIMKVLWDAQKAMTINEVSEALAEQGISIPSVAQAMKRLMTKKAVEIGEYTLVTNVYARTFQPCLSRDAYVREELERIEKYSFANKKHAFRSMMLGLLHMDDGECMSAEDVEELERFLEQKKQELQKEQ